MYYIRHYIIFPAKEFSLCKTLEEDFNIRCDIKERLFLDGEFSYSFDVPENHPMIDRLDQILPKETPARDIKDIASSDSEDTVLIVYYPVYSEEDYCNAKWLGIRSCFSKIRAENPKDVYRWECMVEKPEWKNPIWRHRRNNESYIIKSPIKWKTNAIACSLDNTVLFCNDRARKIFEAENLVGLKYIPVIHKASGEPMANIYQLGSCYTTLDTAIAADQDSTSIVCDQCGMHMIVMNSTKATYGVLEGSLSDDVDFYQTPPMIAGITSKGVAGGHSEFIISQRMYQVMRANKIDRNVIFIPIETKKAGDGSLS